MSTCHFVVDGYGHAWLAARLAAGAGVDPGLGSGPGPGLGSGPGSAALPALAPVAGAIALGVAWRELAVPRARALPLAYALGRLLHRRAGRAPRGSRRPSSCRSRRGPATIPSAAARGGPAASSGRCAGGAPGPCAAFEARARAVLAREASGHGLVSRLLAAARGTPAPLAWKRRGISASRPRWLDRFADVIGGRACLSRIRVDAPLPPTCAVSSPARLAAAADPLGACVITLIEDGARAAITACGSGLAGTPAAAAALLDELLALAA